MFNKTKTSIVKRVIRTFKTKMWHYFTAKKMRYLDMLPDLVYSYNHSKHCSIGRQPALVNLENEEEVFHALYHNVLDNVQPVKYKFKIGDHIRISKIKRKFEKGYLPNYSKEIFTVSKTVPRNLVVYKLKDCDGEELKGTFYDKELQKVIKHYDMCEVEKILKKQGKGKKCTISFKMVWLLRQIQFMGVCIRNKV